ncbi:MAG: hypothetical protein CUN50_04390, partial [Candidatus Thermofonsia Clade 1 bacterium]
MRRYAYMLLTLVLISMNLPHFVQAQASREDILFVSDYEGNREIYAIRPDGSNLRRLTYDPAEDVSPAWSPDKTRIAFASRRSGNFDIYVMDSNGGNVRQVTRNMGRVSSPTWSPDGRRIAFISDRTGSSEIFIISVDGGAPQQVTRSTISNRSRVLTPAWSPDGGRIAYSSDRGSGILTIHVVDLRGRKLYEYLSLSESDEAVSPSWSGDGRLAFAVNSDGFADIITIDFSNDDLQLIMTLPNKQVQSLSWSPDSQQLVYITRSQGQSDMAIIDVSSQGITQLPSYQSTVMDVSWGALPLMAPIRADTGGGNSRGSDSGGSGGDVVSVRTPPPLNQRRAAPPGAVRLNNGRGMGNGARQDNGNFQVENYCADLWHDDVNWYCGSYRLGPEDFDAICQRTYNNPNAF